MASPYGSGDHSVWELPKLTVAGWMHYLVVILDVVFPFHGFTGTLVIILGWEDNMQCTKMGGKSN